MRTPSPHVFTLRVPVSNVHVTPAHRQRTLRTPFDQRMHDASWSYTVDVGLFSTPWNEKFKSIILCSLTLYMTTSLLSHGHVSLTTNNNQKTCFFRISWINISFVTSDITIINNNVSGLFSHHIELVKNVISVIKVNKRFNCDYSLKLAGGLKYESPGVTVSLCLNKWYFTIRL